MLDSLINFIVAAIFINILLIILTVIVSSFLQGLRTAKMSDQSLSDQAEVDTAMPSSKTQADRKPQKIPRNYPLYIGGFLSLIFLLLAIFGPMIAPKDPMEISGRLIIEGETYLRPYRPFVTPGYILGSDEVGRDVLSRLLYGIRPTLFIAAMVVLIRFIIAFPLGLLAGWYKGLITRVIDLVLSTWLAVPSLIFCIALIGFVGIYRGPWVFILALSLTGWADLSLYIKNHTQSLKQASFIESAKATGLKNHRIFWRYIIPQLWPLLPALIAFELSAVILLIAELGFLGFFIGGGQVYGEARGDTPADWLILTSGYPELGQLISDVWAKIIQVPWLLLVVSLTILLLVFAFNLLGEGLRRATDIRRPRQARWRIFSRKFRAA